MKPVEIEDNVYDKDTGEHMISHYGSMHWYKLAVCGYIGQGALQEDWSAWEDIKWGEA